jgi:hypothetical protein
VEKKPIPTTVDKEINAHAKDACPRELGRTWPTKARNRLEDIISPNLEIIIGLASFATIITI